MVLVEVKFVISGVLTPPKYVTQDLLFPCKSNVVMDYWQFLLIVEKVNITCGFISLVT